jgi:glyoxylase-like metal-dependent hydrolase (beta-lactamase superfamily II)
MLLKKRTVGQFQSNCYLVGAQDADSMVVIDPGDEPDRICTDIEETERTPVCILATHGHMDHVGAVKAVKETYDIPFYLHEDDMYLVQNLEEQARAFGLSAPPQPEVDGHIEVGTLEPGAGLTFDVRHTPGHSPGGVTFYSSEHEQALVGDCVFAGSIGRADFPRADHQTLIGSIKKQILTLPDDTELLPGHGPNTTVGEEKTSNPHLQQEYNQFGH